MKQITEIYLDNAATTRPHSEVIARVAEIMSAGYGNASSRHRQGLRAAREIAAVEERVSSVVGGGPWRVLFTSGGTESDTLAVLGAVPKGKRNRVISTTVEHAAVDEACKAVAARGGSYLQVGAGLSGVVSPDELAAAVDDRTALVSMVYVAGEMGTIQKVAEAAKAVKARCRRCLVHVDAVQALGRLPALKLPREVDMATLSAHKIRGPQGVGALLIRPDISLRPILFGGDQQGGVRPGTFNLAGIAGFGTAIELFDKERHRGVPRMAALGDRLVHGILEIPGTVLLGDPVHRAPGMAVISFDGVTSEVLLHTLEDRGVMASASSACHSTQKAPPRCLVDAGLQRGAGAVRFSLGLDTTEEEIDAAITVVAESVRAVRSGRAGLS